MVDLFVYVPTSALDLELVLFAGSSPGTWTSTHKYLPNDWGATSSSKGAGTLDLAGEVESQPPLPSKPRALASLPPNSQSPHRTSVCPKIPKCPMQIFMGDSPFPKSLSLFSPFPGCPQSISHSLMESKKMNTQRVSITDSNKNIVLQEYFHDNREVVEL